MKELKLFKLNDKSNKDGGDYYLLGYIKDSYNITGILLNDIPGYYNNKGKYSEYWDIKAFNEYDDDNITSGNISITANVSDLYLDKNNNNPVMKCHMDNITRYDNKYILINSMEEYEGSLEDLKKVDKVIIKVH